MSDAADFATPRRPVALRLLSGRAHYDEVVAATVAAHTSVWIATANLKELMIEDHRARPGVRRRLGRATAYRSVLAAFAELAARGVELRILHAELPSRPFRAEIERHPALAPTPDGGGLQRRVCPRVHLKAVIVDGAALYLGSANWTGAGLGARGSGRRNFELGVLTDDALLLDQVQALYDRIWRGGECAACKLRAVCPKPIDTLGEARGRAEVPAAPPAARPPRARRPKRPRRRRAAPPGGAAAAAAPKKKRKRSAKVKPAPGAAEAAPDPTRETT